MYFSKRLKSLRKKSTIKQKEISEQLNIAVRTCQKYEHGDYEPNIATLIKLADIFDVTLDYLVGRNYLGHATPSEEN